MGVDQEMVSGNGSDSDYEFPEYEDSFVHLRLENPEFDTKTGTQLSTPFIQKFSVRDYQQTVSVGGFAQYKVEVLHDPTKGAAMKKEPIAYVPGNITDEAANQAKGLVTEDKKDGGLTPVVPVQPQAPYVAPVSTLDQQPILPPSADQNDGPAWDKGFKKADYQAKYKELYGEDAESSLTIPDLTEAIEAKLSEQE